MLFLFFNHFRNKGDIFRTLNDNLEDYPEKELIKLVNPH